MKVFPNNISESFWRVHLNTYSHTLLGRHAQYSIHLPEDLKGIDPHRLYICPICVKSYFVDSPKGVIGNSEFSADHLPPGSVGGKTKIITCKKCNNEAGKYESELLKLVNFGSIPDQKYKSILPRAHVIDEATGEGFDVIVQNKDGLTDIKFNEEAKIYNERLKGFLKELHSDKPKTLKLLVGGVDFVKTERALLKSAYLMCFAWWGYDFVFSSNAELIRDVLNGTASYPTRVPTTWHEKRKNPLPLGISIISKHNIKMAFSVILELKSIKESFMASVLIPGPGSDGWNRLREIDIFATGENLTEFTGVVIPRIVVRNGYEFAWNMKYY